MRAWLGLILLVGLLPGCSAIEPMTETVSRTLQPGERLAWQFEILEMPDRADVSYKVQAESGAVDVMLAEDEDASRFVRGDSYAMLSPPGKYRAVQRIADQVTLLPGEYGFIFECVSEESCSFTLMVTVKEAKK